MTKRNAATLQRSEKGSVGKRTAQVRRDVPGQHSDLVVRTADAVGEACCLAAVAVIPLYFPLEPMLEPAKARVLIALATLAAQP